MGDKANNTNTDIILDIEVRYEDAINGIAKYKTQIDAVKKANADLKKELINGKISQNDYNKAIAANNEIISQCNEATRTLRREIQNNIKTEKNQEGSIKKLQSQIANLNRQYELMGKAEREAASGKELLNHINDLQKELNTANEARQRFQGNVGNYENAIKNALGVNNQFTDSIINMSKSSTTGEQSLKSFFSNAGTSVTAFGKALLGLLSNPVFLAIAGIVGVGVAFKFWYDYNKGLVEATKLTKDFTGLAGNELKAFRNEIQGVSDAYGKDFKETLEATNAVAKQFGISQQEALQYVKDGFIAGADANGEYLSTLKEYPAYFKEAGISASQFIAITAETANQGIFSDKGIDAIKEANIRLREMTTSTASALNGIGISSKQVQQDLQSGATTTFEVMQKVSAKLNEYPDQSKEVGTAIADIFGGAGEDAGLQYIKTLKDIDTNLDEVKKKSGELGEIQARQMQANIDLQNAVAALFDQTGGTFESLIGNAKVFATESLTSIVKGLIDVVNWCIDLYNRSIAFRAVLNGYVAYIKSIWSVLSHLFSLIIGNLKVIGTALEGIFTADFSKIKQAFTDYVDNIKTEVVGLASDISDAVTTAVEDSVNNTEIGKIEIPTVVVPQTEGTTVIKPKGNKPDMTEDMKKAALAEKKASLELAKFKLETEIKSQKDIANNQNKSYQERLNGLNNYFNLQKAYIEKDKEQQLKQTGLTASQKALIIEKSNQKQLDLDQELADKSLQIMKDEETRQINLLNTDIQNKLTTVKQGSDEELALKLQQLEIQRQAEIDAAEKTGADKAAINAKYFALEQQERQKQTNYINSQSQIEYQNKILQAQLNNQNTLALQVEAKRAEIDSIKQLETESDIDFLNRKLNLQNQLKDLEDDYINYQVDVRTKALQAISTIAGGFQELFESLAEDNEAFAEFAKAMALYQIGIDTAAALSAGIAASQAAGPFPANLVAIATTVATVLSNIAKAKKYLTSEKQPKTPSFATGGFVSGLGSGTSDSISAKLSNGESVLTARATSMFSPILSAFNQIGGGVPISTQDVSSQILGEDMLTRAFSNAVRSLPSPIVSVQEIDNVNNRITTLETTRNL